MTNDTQDTFERLEQIVVAGASALREALGVPVTARDVQEVSDAVADAPADGVAARADTARGAVVAAGGREELEAAGDGAQIIAALASQIAVAAGSEPTGSEMIADVAAAEMTGAVGARFELTVDGSVVPVVVAVDNGLFAESAPEPAGEDSPTVSRAPLPELGLGGAGDGAHDLQVLADVSMRVTVELGHTQLPVRELLSLGEGSVVELDQAPGTPVEILVNGTTVARGDVVVVDEELGVRITEILGKSMAA